MTTTAPAIFHLAGRRRIIGSASWEVIFTLGRTVSDAITVAEDATLTSDEAVFDADDVGAEVQAIDPTKPEGKNLRTDVLPRGTRIASFTDASHVELTAPAGVSANPIVVRIFARDLTGSTFEGAIKEYPDLDSPVLVDLNVAALGGTPRGRVRMRLDPDETAILEAAIGTPRPAEARGVYDVFELNGTDRWPRLAGAVEVEQAITHPGP